MAKLINKLLILSLAVSSSSCTIAETITENKDVYTIENSLKACVSLAQKEAPHTYNNTTLLLVDPTIHKSIAYCGCKSALAQYRVYSPNQNIASGLLDFRSQEKVNLTLSNTTSLLNQDNITISLSCAQPQ
ncbi:DUF2195 family protein [Kangiella marina]|uniref:DUF2195 family protein n=1 Tax=Kangiella marina TaxID=1079178 RepID=A0ABP8IIH2_9GAMM